jgi:predicted ATP-grasp superfamily ATP-dependent carboligase
MRALIVHPGDGRPVLTASRALASAGWTVGIGSPERNFISVSRSCRRWHRVPSAWEDAEAFVEATKAAVVDGGYEVVFGAGDAEALALAAHRDELRAPVAHPPYERLLRVFDKLELASAARRVGLDTPRSVDSDAHGREVVVKPRINGFGPRQKARLFADPAEAARRAAELAEAGAEPIVQERVRGSLMAYVAVTDRDSRVVARVQQRAEHIFPPGAGTTARGVTIPIDDELAAKVSRLLGDVGWFGLAQFQFLATEHGPPLLIDFNGRFYGSMALGAAAGVNLPAIWACLATGKPVAPSGEASIGVRFQWLEGDLRRAFAERRGGLARDLAGSLRFAPGAAHNTSSAADPLPLLRLVASRVSASLRFRSRAAWRTLRPQRSAP